MIRKLAFALSLLGACVTGLVHALGLGDATVKSSLNQPLTAEIELVNVGELEVDEILPGLASREEFLKAGVDRVYFLSDIRFNVTKNEKGRLVVVLTTAKPVREPFINFLVEVIWPSGRLLREYALLIDPPLFNNQVAEPVQAAVTYQAARGDNLAIARQSGSEAFSAPVSESSSRSSVSRSVDGGYGPTNERDTLWEIALRARPDGSVSPQQVMLAIQDLNPTAFIDHNINKLKAGHVLRLPTLDQIRQRDGEQAIRQVIAQNEALTSKRGKTVVSASEVQPKVRATVAAAPGDELKLVVAENQSTATNSANSGSSATNSKNADGGSEKLSLALEKLDKATIENSELSGRVRDLEGQLQTLQRLLTLKNDQLTSVQEQIRANEQAKLESEQAKGVAETARSTEPEKSAISEASVETDQTVVTEVITEAQTPDVSQIAVTETAETADAKTAIPAEVTEEVKPVIVERKSKVQVAEKVSDKGVATDNLFESIVSNPFYLAIAVVGVFLLAALLWFVARNNSKKEQEFQSRVHRHDDESADYDKSHGASDFDLAEEEYGASANLEDEEEGDRQDLDHETEDVIAEADVYIAYGRLDQAASILEEAISLEPVRIDYRLKLLEVYKESNDVDAFNRQFSELEAIQDADAIAEAMQIRRELMHRDATAIDDDSDWLDERRADSGRQTKQSAKPEQQNRFEAQSQDDEISNELDFDLADADKGSDEVDIDYGSEELDLDLDLDLNLDEESDAVDKSRVSKTELADRAAELAENDDDQMAPEEPDDDSINDALDAVLSEDLDAVGEQDLSDELDENLDVEFNDIEFSEELDQENEIELPEDLSFQEDAERTVLEPPRTREIVSDDILDEAVEALADDEEFDANLGEEEEFDFLEGTDEASTKLDLARAYIDMGDIDGARDILEEVSKEGSDAQRAEAQSLLDSLSGQ